MLWIMLLRRDDRGLLAIGQSSHAWISGQLARAWGNERFPGPEPHEEVCLGAEQHDIGMAEWDLEPALDPQTGLPYSFMEMPLDVHLRLWSAAPRRVLSQSPYAALLISMHGARLYRRRNLEQLPDRQADAVTAYLEREQRFQDQLVASLEGHPGVADGVLSRNSQLLWTWDYLSLGLCLGWRPGRAQHVPTADGTLDLELISAGDDLTVRIAPWPLATGRVTVRCQGRRLPERYTSEPSMRAALESAPWEALELELVREG